MPRIPTRILTSLPNLRGGVAPSHQTPGPYQSTERFRDRSGNRIQTASKQANAKASGQYDSDNNVFAGVQFVGGTTKIIQHLLGRAYVGARVENPVGNYLAYRVVPNSDARLNAMQIQIQCSLTLTADVVVY